MKCFKDFGITASEKPMTGDKIKINRVVNREIVIHDFKIKESKYPEKGNGKCLHLQIEVADKKHVLFTGAVNLMEIIERIPKENFPFKTTIVEEELRYEFT